MSRRISINLAAIPVVVLFVVVLIAAVLFLTSRPALGAEASPQVSFALSVVTPTFQTSQSSFGLGFTISSTAPFHGQVTLHNPKGIQFPWFCNEESTCMTDTGESTMPGWGTMYVYGHPEYAGVFTFTVDFVELNSSITQTLSLSTYLKPYVTPSSLTLELNYDPTKKIIGISYPITATEGNPQNDISLYYAKKNNSAYQIDLNSCQIQKEKWNCEIQMPTDLDRLLVYSNHPVVWKSNSPFWTKISMNSIWFFPNGIFVPFIQR